MNCPLIPFYPLQNNGKEKYNEVKIQLKQWSDSLLKILDQTQNY